MGKSNLKAGQRFGKLTVIGYIKGNKENKIRALRICQCDCGNIINKTDKGLLRHKNPSCGCLSYSSTKTCSICKIEKDKSEYHKLNSKKTGVQVSCKTCTSNKRKEKYWSNREDAINKLAISRARPNNALRRKEYYIENKEKYKERYHRYMLDESKRDKKKQTALQYKKTSNYKIQAQKRKYHAREDVKTRRKDTHLKRKETDIQYNIKRRLRFRLRHAIKAIGGNKFKYKSSIELLGCDILFFKSYIESKFKDGMCWDKLSEIHIDHIKPCSKFDLTKIDHQKKCFHYSNLQPLWGIDNLIKGAKY